MPDPRPDIVLVMTDEHRYDWLGCTSGGAFDTPTIDGLAASGLRFDQAYSGHTTCVPSRTAILTGLHHHRTPSVPGGLALEPGFWTVARGLRSVGYETALIGRMHFTPTHADHGFDTMRICENVNRGSGYEDVTDDYQQWLASEGRPDWRILHPRDDGTVGGFDAAVPRVFPDEERFHPTAWIEREAIRFLERRAATPGERTPLLLIVSFPHPHGPYDPPEPYASMYDPTATVLPTDGFEVNAVLHASFARDLGHRFTKRADGPEGRARLREVLTAIKALVRQIDDSVGRIVAHLDLPRTALFVTADHGDYGGHRGLMAKHPWIPFDDLWRVPLVVAGGAVAGAPRRSSALVQTGSFAPTALELAGVEVPTRSFDFPSLVPLLAGEEAAFVPRPLVTFAYPSVRRGRHKLITGNLHQDLMLFDLEADPGETVSLADDPAHAELTQDLLMEIFRVSARPAVGSGEPHPFLVTTGAAAPG